MVKKKHIKMLSIIGCVFLVIISIFLNVFPPIYELENTYHYQKYIDDNGVEYYTFYKYYLIQNPPNSQEKLLQMVDEYICQNNLIKNELTDKNDRKYAVSLVFCQKSYTPFGIHRFWHGKLDADIQSYGEEFIIIYYAEVNNGSVKMRIGTNIDDQYQVIKDDFLI